MDPGFDVELTAAEVESLLGRPDRVVDASLLQARDRKILITGAGGSLGSLLFKFCWQQGQSLIGLDRAEAGLFRLLTESSFKGRPEKPQLVVRDAGCPSVFDLMKKARVRVVVHCAAHKHVGLMEGEEEEAFRNNVELTQALLVMAERAGVEDFLLLSTDKAVEAQSVMGRSKAAAETLVLAERDSPMRRRVLRLPNVLGSAGSVAQVFRRAILLENELELRAAQATRLYIGPQEALESLLAALHWQGSGLLVPEAPEAISTLCLAERAQELWGDGRSLRFRDHGLGPGERLHEKLMSSHAEGLVASVAPGLSLLGKFS